MSEFVVDTNVAIVANGRESTASIECRLNSIRALRRVLRGRVVLDLEGEMEREYRRHLNPRGQPGVGDQFLRSILMSEPRRVKRVELIRDSKTGEYIDFPADPALTAFDADDRKFAAAARKERVPVMNSVDSDWLQHRDALAANGIAVKFICGRVKERWFE